MLQNADFERLKCKDRRKAANWWQIAGQVLAVGFGVKRKADGIF
jgi:hypothetical protein